MNLLCKARKNGWFGFPEYNILHQLVSSLLQALLHACIACSLKPSIDWIAASDLEDESEKLVLNLHSCISVDFCFVFPKILACVICFVHILQTPEAHAAAWETLRVSITVVNYLLINTPTKSFIL